ncbi:hypothetical protein WR25_25720 [Diploscapter pachys]|uniref:Uncharacterized protein n=1 Tax=Diploscapter pachys TaxID=2018661 RepID=A0A2A2KWD4_9BILA|nr:hypothetical protein WR25_25720 [Diploscapter pachys]
MLSTKKLAKMTLTIALITSNTILMFTVPDLILIFNPDYSSNLFYVMNLCKGLINAAIFLYTQAVVRSAFTGTRSSILEKTVIKSAMNMNGTGNKRFTISSQQGFIMNN